jgi:dihydrofolate reductase
MRKIFLFMMTSLDGYFEGPDHDLSWHNVDEEFNEFAVSQLKEIDTLIFGHRTYDLMANYWPKIEPDEDAEVAELMNSHKKIVFSYSLTKADWANTTVETDIDRLKSLKTHAGKDLAVFGSNNLCVSLLKAGLLDEIRIMVAPVVIGKGHSLFTGVEGKLNFHLEKTREFKNGNVLLTYKPAS